MKKYIAHRRQSDNEDQSLADHLQQTAELASLFAQKIKLPSAGFLMGLLHDFGKYSPAFQDYIKSALGDYDVDDGEWVDSKKCKGKIDHSTAGAQYVWDMLKGIDKETGYGELCGQILALCIASHHSGLINCLKADGVNQFLARVKKEYDLTHYPQAKVNTDPAIQALINEQDYSALVKQMTDAINKVGSQPAPQQLLSIEEAFSLGTLTRFLFSCLIDADRLNSIEFETPEKKQQRLKKKDYYQWSIAIKRLDKRLSTFPIENTIDQLRRDISDTCYQRATDNQGIYTLTVPTGGGKTLASLRYAFHHAQKHGLDRIIYIIPYTSIIEQNAEAVRDFLEKPGDPFPWVLEHHSNIEPERQTWHSKLASDNWDAPVVFTTMVQFLEALFSGGTRSVRRMHQLARSVLIFDEIQTLPIKCAHMFCHSLNFLVEQAGSTAILCTATQPLLNELSKPEYGQLRLADNHEIVKDKAQLFKDLGRVKVNNLCKPEHWKKDEIVEWVLQRFEENKSCLVIVNTKKWARELFESCTETVDQKAIFHLSSHQCAANRKGILGKIKSRLKNHEPVLCISTQLIEAGVDVDFANVIRFLAGLDSIAQAAGRCNRNGRLKNNQGELILGQVDVINPKEEKISQLVDIVEGQQQTRRVFQDCPDNDILSLGAMQLYFRYFFFERHIEMVYPLDNKESLLELLSNNQRREKKCIHPKYGLTKNQLKTHSGIMPMLAQSFMDAGKIFNVIDAPTHSVIVPYGEGAKIINDLCAINKDFDIRQYYKLLKKAQQYSVNVFPNTWKTLCNQGIAHEIQGEGAFYVNEENYSEQFGLSEKTVSGQSFLSC